MDFPIPRRVHCVQCCISVPRLAGLASDAIGFVPNICWCPAGALQTLIALRVHGPHRVALPVPATLGEVLHRYPTALNAAPESIVQALERKSPAMKVLSAMGLQLPRDRWTQQAKYAPKDISVRVVPQTLDCAPLARLGLRLALAPPVILVRQVACVLLRVSKLDTGGATHLGLVLAPFASFLNIHMYTQEIKNICCYAFCHSGKRALLSYAFSLSLGLKESPKTLCTKGHYCPEGATSPRQCPIGTYNDQEGQDDQSGCLTCPPGKPADLHLLTRYHGVLVFRLFADHPEPI